MKRLVATLLLFATWPCRAQQGTTGELTGIVRSGDHPLPGVTVTLTSEALQLPRAAMTGANGGFLFALLPPAEYTVRFELQGFATEESRVRVSLSETAEVDTAMTMHEEIVVKPAASAADLDATALQQLPGPRSISAITLLSPQVNALGPKNALVIAGAPSWQNLYLIDGVAASEYLTGQPHDVVLEDAIQEVVVLTKAISAEYGRFTGGVISTLTKSGGNEFSGSFRDTLSNPRWTMRTPWPGEVRPESQTNHAAEATLGGFIIKDRLWFFSAFRNARSTLSRFTYLTQIPYSNSTEDRRSESKLTVQIAQQHSMVVSYAGALLEERNALDTRNGANVLDLSSLIADRKRPTRLASATYSGIVAPNATAELQYSQKRYALRGNGGMSSDRILGTVIVVNGFGNANAPFGCGICGDDARNSQSMAAKGSFYRNTRWGNHTLVAGGDDFRESRTNAGTRSASEFNINTNFAQSVGQNVYPFFGPSTGISWTHHFPGDEGSHLDTSSAYINDRWDLNGRFTLNVGFRHDRNNARDAAGRLISDDAAWSPRLGATFDLGHQQQLLASYGRYASKILEAGGSSQQVGTFDQYGWKYNGPQINSPGTPADQLLPAPQALAKLFAWFDANGGINNTQFLRFITTPDTTNIFHGSLQSPSVDEASLGYAVHFRRGYVRADAIARDWHHFYAARVDHTTGQTTDPAGHPIDLVWVINDNSETARRYRALQLEGSWRWQRVSAGGGYVLSTLRGNDDEEDPDGLSGGPRNYPLAFWYPELLGYPQRKPYGYLRQDERHRLRAWAAYNHGGFTVLVLQRFDSGHPFSEVVSIDVSKVLPNDGYTLSQLLSAPYYIGGKRGALRTDDVYNTDVSVQYDIAIRNAHLFAKADVLNLLNNSAVVTPGTTLFSGAPFLVFNPFTDTPIAGINYQLGPDFGKATGPQSYQTPRTYQIAVGARF